MMIHSVFFLLAVLSFLSLLTSTFGSSADDASSAADCSSSSTCGDVSISYPFWRSDGPPSFSAVQCGYPGFGIACELEDKQQPILQIGSGRYNVSHVDYDSRTIDLTDTNVLTSPDDKSSCPIVRHNLTFAGDVASSLNYTGADANLTFLFNCSVGDGPPHDFLQYNVIPCLGYADKPSFVFRSDDVPYNLTFWSGTCEDVVVAPVLLDILSDPGWDPAHDFSEALNYGFQLAWMAGAAEGCGECESSGGHCGFNQTSGSPLCFCPDGTRAGGDCPVTQSKNKHTGVIIGSSVGAAAGLVGLCGLCVFLYIRTRRRRHSPSSSNLIRNASSSVPNSYSKSKDPELGGGSSVFYQTHLFSYDELEAATDGFSDSRELGDGGFGTVYKGILRDGRVVAIKRLYENNWRRVEQFKNEVAILSLIRHPNLVALYGCTSRHSRELLLVYEYISNGTIADHLHGSRADERALTWPRRLSIAIETADALAYLHAVNPPIIHRDVKTNNILLDADFHVKVADFGLSRLFPLDATHVSTAPQGTPGYVDPEYHKCFQLTDKSDVYSFGVVLVELISSMPAVDITRRRDEINLANMAIRKIQNCQLEELVDAALGYEEDLATKRMITMVAELAFRCLQPDGEMRPPIREVVEVLRGIQREGYNKNSEGEEGDIVVKEDSGLLKNIPPFSPDSVAAKWPSRTTTPNTSE
ncbi:LEAF RUST 10 DISEASE-RESISTANCE LOCUS RECEPTOR-LIKE PROTEIN KINASE-like 1.2 isoform X1 [Ananas comosus]|uniref:non-specific serine/threonine protein kinase n=1 Tax=Ananas comosus TaxID=4615 RepID=A0A6P5GDS8_ANACO|nr:LEAF RUST 10 DISEASE-RESISTANCE LOCUS RECEPTOR-LIKE PROTEIN KINASE-like 1.2 isoform X1 [Ananas comosus]